MKEGNQLTRSPRNPARLSEDGELRLGGLNFAVSLVLGVAVAWAGRELGATL